MNEPYLTLQQISDIFDIPINILQKDIENNELKAYNGMIPVSEVKEYYYNRCMNENCNVNYTS